MTQPKTPADIKQADIGEVVVLHDEEMLFAIRNGQGQCLSKSGQWLDEPELSERTSDFVAQCRFENYQEAVDLLAHFGHQQLTFEQVEEMATVLTNLAEDILESGIEEWDDLDEAIESTVTNVSENLIEELTKK
jgi:hypothetical protein